jgi:hypothetical protein
MPPSCKENRTENPPPCTPIFTSPCTTVSGSSGPSAPARLPRSIHAAQTPVQNPVRPMSRHFYAGGNNSTHIRRSVRFRKHQTEVFLFPGVNRAFFSCRVYRISVAQQFVMHIKIICTGKQVLVFNQNTLIVGYQLNALVQEFYLLYLRRRLPWAFTIPSAQKL